MSAVTLCSSLSDTPERRPSVSSRAAIGSALAVAAVAAGGRSRTRIRPTVSGSRAAAAKGLNSPAPEAAAVSSEASTSAAARTNRSITTASWNKGSHSLGRPDHDATCTPSLPGDRGQSVAGSVHPVAVSEGQGTPVGRSAAADRGGVRRAGRAVRRPGLSCQPVCRRRGPGVGRIRWAGRAIAGRRVAGSRCRPPVAVTAV